MEKEKIGLKDFIHQVTDELIEAAEIAKSQNRANLSLSKVEIEIATEARRELDGTVKIVVLQADGKVSRAKTHLVRIELKPYDDGGDRGGPPSVEDVKVEFGTFVAAEEETLEGQGRVRRTERSILRDPLGRRE